MIYQTFATLYDEMMDTELYERWLSFVEKNAGHQHPQTLELACGTGILATKLVQAGYPVTGFDLSADMLTLAQQHATTAGVTFPLVQGDMRELDELGTYDLVTCLDDSLCYMPDLAAVTTVFQQVQQHLTSGGRFLFDMHSLYQMDELFPGYQYNYKNETTAFMWASYPGEHPHSIEHDLTFFVWDEAIGGYQALSELHRERTYPLATVKQALLQAGFTNVQVSADFGECAVAADSVRWFFTAEKA
ncbi:class I SAM-dependent DNA methyltransferase [Loigolactobacillus binensis]|uniref:Class I SAM-dependent DNA methyltransferase n=1 Tax=Loigolactobacillus binensis TaxID=2559922 RepID=A0ABW3EAW6_9LACO|nr:class I SAM-dependent methyltransferase [Loigolactobacillus binensis]